MPCSCTWCICTPPLALVKRQANGSLTPQTKFRHNPSSRFRDTERGAYLHVGTCTCICTPPMTCVIFIAAWSLNTHQISSVSAYPFLSYSLRPIFTPPHFANVTCHSGCPSQMDGCWFHSRWKGCSYPSKKTVYQSDPWLQRLSSSKESRDRVVSGRAGPLILRFFTKPRRTRSALHTPLVTK